MDRVARAEGSGVGQLSACGVEATARAETPEDCLKGGRLGKKKIKGGPQMKQGKVSHKHGV